MKKGKIITKLKRIFLGFFLMVFSLIALLYITDNQYVLKGIKEVYLEGRTTASIQDSDDFQNHIITKGKIQPWQLSEYYGKISITQKLDKELSQYNTAAFVVIYKGKLYQEKYFDNYNSSSKTNSFSMAKSVTTLLLGKAIEEGYIKGLDESIINYLPEYKNDTNAKLCKIKNLTGMTSGYDWSDDYYFPIHHMAKAYYNDDMSEVIFSRNFIKKPGTEWKYQSGTTQLEGYVLRRALKKPLAEYASEKLWKPLGMESDALWTVDDKDQMEKAYCCIHSNARDFAKLGQLLLNKGQWNGKQLIDSTYVKWMTTPTEISNYHYAQTLWTDKNWKYPFYMFRGHLGQYIIIVPDYELVIVRLGEQRDRSFHNYSDQFLPKEIYVYIEETIEHLPKNATKNSN